MRPLKQLCAAFVLTLVLALSSFAGEMSTMIAPPPSASQATMQGNMSTTVAGEMSTTITATDLTMEIALNLLQSALSLF